LTVNYSGALFQLYNGSATLNIAQTGSGVADMTTWSAFCSGVQSNCKISKIYAQIQGHSNDLVPINVNGANFGNCTTSTNVCAAPFEIESTTSLPVLDATQAGPPTIEYFIGPNDAASIGINAGLFPVTVVFNGQFFNTGLAGCCGSWGLAHLWNGGNVEGTDFLVLSIVGTTDGFAISGNCVSGTVACFGAEQEQVSDGGAISPTPANVLGFIDNDIQNFCTDADYNGHHLYTHCPADSQIPPSFIINPDIHIHLGGGGDLSKTPTVWREGYFYNLILSPNQRATILGNTTNFFSGLTYQ
jgi:hypothetical protein